MSLGQQPNDMTSVISQLQDLQLRVAELERLMREQIDAHEPADTIDDRMERLEGRRRP